MPLLFLIRAVFGLLSLAVLGSAVWLLWSWGAGELVRMPDGTYLRAREDWRLWLGLALLAWSFLGRMVVVPLLTRRDEEKSRPRRGEGRMVQGAGHEIYVETAGEPAGPTLLFTHGWGLDSTIWNLMSERLAGRFRLIRWDLPGLGRSHAPVAAVSLDRFATNLARLVEEAGGPVILVGHSIGGMTIQTLARERPDLFGRQVTGVVLLNTTYTNPLRTMVFDRILLALRRPLIEPMMFLARWLWPIAWLSAWQGYLSGSAHVANRFGFGRFVTHSQLEHTTLLATRNRPDVQAQGNLAMFNWDAGEGLAQLTVPVLVIGSDADIVTKVEASRRIAEAVPGALLEIVEGANHMGFLECAGDYAERICAFTRTLPGAGRPADRAPLPASAGGQSQQQTSAYRP